MSEIPKITGADVLREIQKQTRDLPHGSPFTISLPDSYDLMKLTAKVLHDEFGFDETTAKEVDTELLRRGSLDKLSDAIGIKLVKDKAKRESVIRNAGIIRSAGAAADEEETLEETLSILHKIRHG
jgi:hypothetical protein